MGGSPRFYCRADLSSPEGDGEARHGGTRATPTSPPGRAGLPPRSHRHLPDPCRCLPPVPPQVRLHSEEDRLTRHSMGRIGSQALIRSTVKAYHGYRLRAALLRCAAGRALPAVGQFVFHGPGAGRTGSVTLEWSYHRLRLGWAPTNVLFLHPQW